MRTYDEHRPYIDKVLRGDVTGLFAPGTKVLMFAMTSGTTGEPKRLPITEELFREYRRGWLIWGGGVYGDYPGLMLKRSLQLSSDWQQLRAPSGVACGQISGLAATTRPKLGQYLFEPPAPTTRIHDSAARHYATLRFALATKGIGIIITANPSSLVEFARQADHECEHLLRDIHDGTLSCAVPPEVRGALAPWIGRRRARRRASSNVWPIATVRYCRNMRGPVSRYWRFGPAAPSAFSYRSCRNCMAMSRFEIMACRPVKDG